MIDQGIAGSSFACHRCGYLNEGEYITVPGDDPVLIVCARCGTSFRVPPWNPEDAEELRDDWFPQRILLGQERYFTKSEVQRAKEERDRARLEAELEANPLDEQEEQT